MSPGLFHKLGLGQHACHSEWALGCVHRQRQKQGGKRWRDKAVYKEPFSTKGPLCGPADLSLTCSLSSLISYPARWVSHHFSKAHTCCSLPGVFGVSKAIASWNLLGFAQGGVSHSHSFSTGTPLA